MKNISIKTNLSTVSSNNYFPIVIFGNNLLQAGYDVINNLVLSGGGGGGTITLTKESINAVDSTDTINIENITGQATRNTIDADNLRLAQASRAPGAILPTINVGTSITTDKKEVYPFLTENTEEFENLDAQVRLVPTYARNEILAPEEREVLSEVSLNTTAIADASGLVFDYNYVRFVPGLDEPIRVLEAIRTDTEQVVSSVNTTVKEVVTDASISGTGGSSPYSDSIVYNYEGTEVTISGNGYKRLLSETSNKPIKVSLLRVQIIGATDSQIDDILSQKCYIVNAQGSEVTENIFYPAEFVNPDDYRKNILDIPLEIDYDGNTAIVLGGIQNSDIEIKCTFFYN